MECTAATDLVILFDVSKRMGSKGVEAGKEALKHLVEKHFRMGDENTRIGVVSYSGQKLITLKCKKDSDCGIKTLTDLTADQDAVLDAIDSAKASKRGPDAFAKGVARAGAILQRSPAGRAPMVLMVSSGRVGKASKAKAAVTKITNDGARFIVMEVDKKIPKHWGSNNDSNIKFFKSPPKPKDDEDFLQISQEISQRETESVFVQLAAKASANRPRWGGRKNPFNAAAKRMKEQARKMAQLMKEKAKAARKAAKAAAARTAASASRCPSSRATRSTSGCTE
jgi:hypothetical protein